MLKQIANIAWEDLEYNFISLRHRLSRRWKYQQTPVLVNGSPKTGTTWMLNMVSSIPGYVGIGNFNGDIQRYYDVAPGEVVHGHDWFNNGLGEVLAAKGIKTILMIRDPRDQLVSRMFHIKRSPKHAWHQRFESLSNDEALLLCIEGRDDLPGINTMIKLTQTWLTSTVPTLCIRYEDLLADPLGQFNRVLLFLGIDDTALANAIIKRNRFVRLSVGRRIWQQQRRPGEEDISSHYRKGIVGDWKNHLKESHIQRVKEITGQQLIELGYERDLHW